MGIAHSASRLSLHARFCFMQEVPQQVFLWPKKVGALDETEALERPLSFFGLSQHNMELELKVGSQV